MNLKEKNIRYRKYKTEWQRKWRKTNPKKSRVQLNKDHRVWKKKYPEKYLAHKIVFVEKRAGRLKEKPCKICGILKVEAHHVDYSKPLKVIWLCRKHHREADRKLSTC